VVSLNLAHPVHWLRFATFSECGLWLHSLDTGSTCRSNSAFVRHFWTSFSRWKYWVSRVWPWRQSFIFLWTFTYFVAFYFPYVVN